MSLTLLSDFQSQLFDKLESSLEPFENTMHSIVDEHRNHPTFYADLVYLMGNIRTSNSKAQVYFRRVNSHKKHLEQIRGHHVDLRVAFMDYFVHIQPKYRHPTIVEMADYREKLALAACDSLTGLYNRAYFNQIAKAELARSQRHHYQCSILLLDIDLFKKVNDTFGHPVGDIVLKAMGAFLQGQMRSEDFAFRYGGEEFVVLLPQTGAEGLGHTVRRLFESMPNLYPEGDWPITFSAGAAVYPLDGLNLDALVSCADTRMYKAKLGGRNRSCLADEYWVLP